MPTTTTGLCTAPRGFIEVTLENQDFHVSEHFRLRDFLTKGQQNVWPKYLLVDPQSRRCDVYRLGERGLWTLHPVEPGQGLLLASVALEVSAAGLWAEVPG